MALYIVDIEAFLFLTKNDYIDKQKDYSDEHKKINGIMFLNHRNHFPSLAREK